MLQEQQKQIDQQAQLEQQAAQDEAAKQLEQAMQDAAQMEQDAAAGSMSSNYLLVAHGTNCVQMQLRSSTMQRPPT